MNFKTSASNRNSKMAYNTSEIKMDGNTTFSPRVKSSEVKHRSNFMSSRFQSRGGNRSKG